MNKQVLAIMIPVLAVFFTGLVVLSRAAIGLALARHIGGDRQSVDDVHQHLVDMQSELQALRQELTETQERLDFTERVIANQVEPGRVGPPA